MGTRIFRYYLMVLVCFSAWAKAPEVIPGQYIVAFKTGRGRAALVNKLNFVQKTKPFIYQADLLEVFVEDKFLPQLEAALKDEVEYIEPVYRLHADRVTPEINFFSDENSSDAININPEQWGLKNKNNIDVDATTAWKMTKGDPSVVVAVIDTGVDYTHGNLRGSLWVNENEIPGNGIDDDGNGYKDDVIGWDFHDGNEKPYDEAGHGTHVAGIIAAYGKVSGIAPKVKIMPLRFLGDDGSGSTADAVRAIDYAIMQKANVINCSWGGSGNSRSLEAAMMRTQRAGILVVAAAGNGAENSDEEPHYPSSYQFDNVISVAAATPEGNLASFSNYGKSVHIAAPGFKILSTIPEGKTKFLNGTSMAAPFVAGIAALMYSVNPDLSAWHVRDILMKAGKVTGNLASKIRSGRLVNAGMAVKAAKDY